MAQYRLRHHPALRLAACYRPEPTGNPLRALARAAAFGTVTALCVSLVVAWPLQQWLDASGTAANCWQFATQGLPDSPTLGVVGSPPGELVNAPPDRAYIYDDCVGGVTNGKLQLVWLGTALALTILALLKWHRSALADGHRHLVMLRARYVRRWLTMRRMTAARAPSSIEYCPATEESTNPEA